MADDPLGSALKKIRDRDVIAYASPKTMAESGADVSRLLDALDAVLVMHAPTALVRYCEPCPAHALSILSRFGCPDCKLVKRNGCQRCRDEYGNPARPEDCAERNAILRALTGKGNDGGS